MSFMSISVRAMFFNTCDDLRTSRSPGLDMAHSSQKDYQTHSHFTFFLELPNLLATLQETQKIRIKSVF